MGFSRKKNRGMGHGISIQSGVEKTMWKFQGSILSTKKDVEFQGVFKIEKLHVEFPLVLFFMGFDLAAWKFQRCHTILQNLQVRGKT